MQEKDFKKVEFSDILFYSEMITKERHERERLALRSAIFPEFMTGKFQEKSWARFTQGLGIGEPEEEYTKEDWQRDVEASKRVIARAEKAKYERVV